MTGRPQPFARARRQLGAALLCAGLSAISIPAAALDKQGSAHGGDIQGATSGFGIAGGLMLGVSIYNPTYAARPDNTGLALMRYAGHADIDLIGRRLSVPLDINMFTNREADGAAKLAPSELDIITGVTTTWGLGPGALELGSRFEYDTPVNPRSGATQSYVDVRARYLYSAATIWPSLAPALRGGDVSGWFTLGWFVYNPSYFARPDNTGRALFRYGVHSELSVANDLFSVGIDATLFTDRESPNPLRPSELDLTPELIVRRGAFEAHLALEVDMPVDQGTLVQKFVYVLGIWSFSLFENTTRPLEERGEIALRAP